MEGFPLPKELAPNVSPVNVAGFVKGSPIVVENLCSWTTDVAVVFSSEAVIRNCCLVSYYCIGS